MAGSNSLATTLASTTNYLTRYPSTLEKLTREIRSKSKDESDMNLESLTKLPYLSAVIEEGLRICAPVPLGMPRVVPEGGDTVCVEWLPAGSKLTPKLSSLVPTTRDELAFALEKEFPRCDEWKCFEIYEVLRRIVSRTSARIFVGPDLCRNEDWLYATHGYTENAFITIVAPRHAKRIVVPIIKQRNEVESQAKRVIDEVYLENFLKMMMDDAVGSEGDPTTLTQRVLSLTLASNHTTTIAPTRAIYDMCTYPEYICELREEVQRVINDDGGWHKSRLAKMKKLDSFMKTPSESIRQA
ncbi:hypothetical protein DSL72_006055 [Monilinia vaccinii-corymbosi]|uniref:Cytochrome P450 n=1 Tax=Monilinia vaccinii-corymbosi TaxID=61207 RepID=A0A8A3PHJ3_9HELO|nr:hypothetical protein DSL72_006055 [Monilinia vaccinii-corymbosi]